MANLLCYRIDIFDLILSLFFVLFDLLFECLLVFHLKLLCTKVFLQYTLQNSVTLWRCLPLLELLQDLAELYLLLSADIFILGHDVIDVASCFLNVPLFLLLVLIRRRRGVNYISSLILQEEFLFLIEDALE